MRHESVQAHRGSQDEVRAQACERVMSGACSAEVTGLAVKQANVPEASTVREGAPKGDPLMDAEERLLEMYASEEPELSGDVMDAIRETDFSMDPDAEEGDDEEEGGEIAPRNVVKVQKNVEVLADGLKRPALSDGVEAMKLRWRSFVSSLRPPLLNIMEHAIVYEFSPQSVYIMLSTAFEGIFAKHFEGVLTQQIRQQFGWQVNLRVVFEANADETATLAAEAARELMAREEAQKDELRNHPLFQAVLETFHLEPERAHITCNSDRIFS